MKVINVNEGDSTHIPPSLRLLNAQGYETENIDLGVILPTNCSTIHLSLVNNGGPFSGPILFSFEKPEPTIRVFIETSKKGGFPIDVALEFFGHVSRLDDLGIHSAILIITYGNITMRRCAVGRIDPFPSPHSED